MSIDLHVHTRVSDGSMDMVQIALLAKRLGLKGLGIANHDTVAGLDEALEVGRKHGIKIIPGIEISAYDYQRGRKAHILGYLMDNLALVGKACQTTLEKRQKNSRWIVEKLQAEGYPISWELVEILAAGSTNVYRQHIVHALLDTGYTPAFRGKLYEKLFGKTKNGMPGGIVSREIEYMDVFKALNIVKKAGGIAVLAHPAGYNNQELIPELCNQGLDGLEVWHPSHNEKAVEELSALAEYYGLLQTGGSDFHGMYEGKENPLGSRVMPQEWLEKLMAFKTTPKGSFR